MTRLIATIVFIIGCGCVGNNYKEEAVVKCQNIVDEYTVGVPYMWAELDDEVNTLMPNGCVHTVITHYVFEPNDSNTDPRHVGKCTSYMCGNVLDILNTGYTDPVRD